MSEFISVNHSNIDLLHKFIGNLGEAAISFRYFSKRGVEAIDNHLLTILYLENNVPIGYGHLDKSDGEVWLGIAIIPSFQGKGIGNQIMDYLLKTAQSLSLKTIALTVDNSNINAIELYLKKGFVELQKFEKYTKYILNLE